VLETGRLAIGPGNMDPTNLLIGAAAAALGFRFSEKMRDWLPQFLNDHSRTAELQTLLRQPLPAPHRPRREVNVRR
jgi:hypothetical protein